MYDVMIIGAGVTGSAIARELMRKKRNIAVLERCSDICEGTSKANSGIVHADLCDTGNPKSENERTGKPDDGSTFKGTGFFL